MPPSSSSYSIEIDDSDLVNAVNNTIPSAINNAVREALEEGANEIQSSAKGSCPVDTGNLQDSISKDVSPTEFTVQATEDYASYVEYGTSKMAAQPYFYSNADRVTSGIQSNIESKLTAKLPN
jgi:HK97 gp10 family phage protein